MQESVNIIDVSTIRSEIKNILTKSGNIKELYNFCQQRLTELSRCILKDDNKLFLFIKGFGRININPKNVRYISLKDTDILQIYVNIFIPIIIQTINEQSIKIKL